MKPILVRDVMTVGVPTCKATTPVVDICHYLLEHNLEEMVVLNEDGEGVGTCGMVQLVGLLGRDDLDHIQAEEVMSEGVPDLAPDLSLPVAAQIMRDRGLRTGYMLHNSAGIIYPAAYLSYRHLLRALAARDETELRDLGIAAERKSPIETFIQRRDEALKRARSQR
jgi:CBS domain-containing protein